MSKEIEKVADDIDLLIAEVEKRIESGAVVIGQCKRQMLNLKRKLKAYRQLKQTVVTKYVGECADGDL